MQKHIKHEKNIINKIIKKHLKGLCMYCISLGFAGKIKILEVLYSK